MSTKQLRISETNQIRSRMREFLGKRISLVLTNGNVFPGILNTVSENSVSLTNMRLKKISIAFDEIGELYFDSNS